MLIGFCFACGLFSPCRSDPFQKSAVATQIFAQTSPGPGAGASITCIAAANSQSRFSHPRRIEKHGGIPQKSDEVVGNQPLRGVSCTFGASDLTISL